MLSKPLSLVSKIVMVGILERKQQSELFSLPNHQFFQFEKNSIGAKTYFDKLEKRVLCFVVFFSFLVVLDAKEHFV